MQVDKKLLVELRKATFAGFKDCQDALIATENNFDEAVKWLKEKGKIKAAKKQGAIAADGAVQYFGESHQIGALIEVNSQTDFVAKNEQFMQAVQDLLKIITKQKVKTVQDLINAKFDNSNISVSEKLTELTAKLGEKIDVRRFETIEAGSGEFVAGYTHANKRIAAIALFKGKNENPSEVKSIMMNIVANNPTAIDKDHLDKAKIDSEYQIILKKTIEEGKPENMAEKIAQGRLAKQLDELCLVNQQSLTTPDKKIIDILKQNNIEIIKFVRYEVGEGIQKKEDNFVEEVNKQMGIN